MHFLEFLSNSLFDSLLTHTHTLTVSPYLLRMNLQKQLNLALKALDVEGVKDVVNYAKDPRLLIYNIPDDVFSYFLRKCINKGYLKRMPVASGWGSAGVSSGYMFMLDETEKYVPYYPYCSVSNEGIWKEITDIFRNVFLNFSLISPNESHYSLASEASDSIFPHYTITCTSPDSTNWFKKMLRRLGVEQDNRASGQRIFALKCTINYKTLQKLMQVLNHFYLNPPAE